MKYEVRFSGKMYEKVQQHLYPGDGNEAVVIALCGRNVTKSKHILLVYQLLPIPYEHCSKREPNRVTWSTSIILPLLEIAAKKNLSVLKIHSHPNGFSEFSEIDDISDKDLFSSVYGWIGNEEPHSSIVMLPDGSMFGRIIHPALNFENLTKISIVGDDIKHFTTEFKQNISREFELRTIQTFGEGTTALLKGLSITVVGCSGTGSPVIEQLVRLGVGKIILIDPDSIEEKNLNRILNSTYDDVKHKRKKVDLFSAKIKEIGIGTEVITYSQNLYDSPEAIQDVSESDAIFGCVDSIDCRHLLNQIATFYIVPYLDLGVKIISNGKGGISQICGSVHYLQPGGSSLQTRNVYTLEELRAAGMMRANPLEYEKQKKSGYIVDIKVESPAVISINMQIASMAVNEFLARIHSFRHDPNSEFAINRISLSDGYYLKDEDGEPDIYLEKFVGRGTIVPLLNMPELNFKISK